MMIKSRSLKAILVGIAFLSLPMGFMQAAQKPAANKGTAKPAAKPAALTSGSILEGDIIDYDFRSGQAVATGHVVITRPDGRITAQKGKYNTKTKEGELTGGVVATQPDGKATCQTLVLAQGGDVLSARGNAVIKKQDKTLQAAQVDYYRQKEYVETVGTWARMLMDDGSTLDAGKVDYNMKSGIANAVGNVRVVSPPRNVQGYGDRAIYNEKVDNGLVELIGNAWAKQNADTVKGDHIFVHGVGGSTVEADGHAKLVYHPEQQEVKKADGSTEKVIYYSVEGVDEKIPATEFIPSEGEEILVIKGEESPDNKSVAAGATKGEES